jgi:2-polyprenyl-3-methyl-5-hydroxy-6-metoxy-1,4-benzoquinol methylase
MTIVGDEYVLRWLPQGTYCYHMQRKPAEIEALLERDDFIVQNATAYMFNR